MLVPEAEPFPQTRLFAEADAVQRGVIAVAIPALAVEEELRQAAAFVLFEVGKRAGLRYFPSPSSSRASSAISAKPERSAMPVMNPR